MTSERPAPTGQTVALFGRLLELDADGRGELLARIRATDARLAGELAALLDRAGGVTTVLTDFATAPASPPARRRFSAGETIAHFTLLEPIGSGGMGEVWRARQSNPERDVALKIIATALSSTAAVSATREPATLAALRHPSIATIFASGVERDFAWIAMEHIADARPITAVAADAPLASRLALLADAADAVAHAHAAGFIHRDLKPSNILIGADGRVKVIDFGIAAATGEPHAGNPLRFCGTPAYLAPEALDADPSLVDARADIRALGVVLYELAYGALPPSLRDPDPIALLRAIRETRFDPPATAGRHERGDLAAIIARATAADPGDRYRTVAALADDLRAFLALRPVQAAPRGTLSRLALAARRHPVGAALAGTAIAALVGATAVSTYYAVYARTAAIEAGALASDVGAAYSSFLQIFIPLDFPGDEARRVTLEEYFRTRVRELERNAMGLRSLPYIEGFDSVAQTLQFGCVRLGLFEEARRCQLVREIVSARVADPRGSTPVTRHLDGVYAYLSESPDDPAALAALDGLVPAMLGEQRIIRAGSLSRIGGVDYLRNPLLSDRVARRILEVARGGGAAFDAELLASAVARLVYGVHSAAATPGTAVGPAEIDMLERSAEIIESLIAEGDDAARTDAIALASGIDLMFTSDLIVAEHPELIPPLARISLLATTPVDRSAAPGDTLGYFSLVPLRLARAGRWDACAQAIAALRAPAATASYEDRSAVALAEAELALHRGGDAARAAAIALLEPIAFADPARENLALDYPFHLEVFERISMLALRSDRDDIALRCIARTSELRDQARAAGRDARAAFFDEARDRIERLRRAAGR